jgi:hypothetical protein
MPAAPRRKGWVALDLGEPLGELAAGGQAETGARLAGEEVAGQIGGCCSRLTGREPACVERALTWNDCGYCRTFYGFLALLVARSILS